MAGNCRRRSRSDRIVIDPRRWTFTLRRGHHLSGSGGVTSLRTPAHRHQPITTRHEEGPHRIGAGLLDVRASERTVLPVLLEERLRGVGDCEDLRVDRDAVGLGECDCLIDGVGDRVCNGLCDLLRRSRSCLRSRGGRSGTLGGAAAQPEAGGAGRPCAPTLVCENTLGNNDLLLASGLVCGGCVLSAAVCVPRAGGELQSALVTVARVDGPVSAGLTLGETIPVGVGGSVCGSGAAIPATPMMRR